MEVLFYGIFVVMPLFFALVVGLTFARRGYKILRDGQVPPKGEKVFKPTPIKRGRWAKVQGYVHLWMPLPFVVLAIWGIPQAEALSVAPTRAAKECAAVEASRQSSLPPALAPSLAGGGFFRHL